MTDVNEIKLLLYQKRVIEEKQVLDEKRVALNRIICGIRDFYVLPEELKRMKNQALAMNLYSNILKDRIDSW